MNPQNLPNSRNDQTEADTRFHHIDPALRAAGWGAVEHSFVRTEYRITDGRLVGNGKREPGLIADYILIYRNTRLAVVEAKAWREPLTLGVGQAKNYAGKLAVRFTYSTNGQGIYEIDMKEGTEREVDSWPTPQELWQRNFADANEWRERFAAVPLEIYADKTPRYYQEVAIERALEAVAVGQQRILLTLATGTGKTFVAFQIAWKLFESRWNLSRQPGRRPRILFLADRNILAAQAVGAFSAFPPDALVRISPDEIRKKGRVPKNNSLFFTIFQTFMSGPPRNGKPSPYFGEYPADFFDFIVIDECHRGGANDESNWRGILDYFAPAVQLGLTATPKRRDNVDTYEYFGEPVYKYSLKEGINDGFLTPFKVRQIRGNYDEYVYTPDDEVLGGEVETGRVYTECDFNRTIEIRAREEYRVRTFLKLIDPNEKTIVFCATQEHALLVRDLVNQNKAVKHPDYCHRVTADDGTLGEEYLTAFQDNEKSVPTILTTSQKLSTGVDALNIRNIVLMRRVGTMIEFKQIVGRGTRLFEGKEFFTIFDFVEAYKHFCDPEWDGDPVDANSPDDGETDGEPEPKGEDEGKGEGEGEGGGGSGGKPEKVRVKLADGKDRLIAHTMLTSYWHPDGTPMSAPQFMELLFGKLPEFFQTEEKLRELWSDPDSRASLLESLEEQGIGREQLAEMQRGLDAPDRDLFDVLAYVGWSAPMPTREDRANRAKQEIGTRFDPRQRAFLEFVLSQYVKMGVRELDRDKLSALLKLKYTSIGDALADLGDAATVSKLFAEFQKYLYSPAVAV